MNITDPFDMIIRGGTVIDGTKAPRFDADVGIRGGHIAAIGDLSAAQATRVINASGRIVAPGFIDAHTHDDQAVLSQPDMSFKISQGVTTVVAGNCGISAAPLRADMELPMPLSLIDSPPDGRFTSFRAYMDALRAMPGAVNVAAMVGHSTLRVVTMDSTDRTATGAEIKLMQAMVEEALDAGAIGMSTGTFYPPAMKATTDEIIEVGRPLTARKALYVTHMRDEGADVMKSLDCYPYTAGSTMIRTDRGMLEGRVLIASSTPHPECAGRDLADIAREWGLSREDAAKKMQPGSAIYFMMDETDVQRIMGFDETMIGSDGIPVGDSPHPRLWGTFARVLGHYSRDVGLFPLETAVWKMTGLTARNFGLAGRGSIAVGNAADVVVFDAATVKDSASYEHPTRAAAGIELVVVNGDVTWRNGAHSGARSGQVLRRSGSV